jgi:hypothetical protein
VWSDAPPLLLKAARRLASFDLGLARETYLTAWGAAGLAEEADTRDVLVEISEAVRTLPSPPTGLSPRDLMLDGFAVLITEGQATATSALQRAALAITGIPAEDVLRWGWMTTNAYAAVFDHEGWLASCTRQVQVVRDAGALAAPPGSRPRAPPLRRVAAPREPPGRRARAAAYRPRDAGRDRDGGIR